MPSIDFAALKKQISLPDVARLLGVDFGYFIRGRHRTPCPVRCCDDKRCCTFDNDKNLFICHRCQANGGPIDLYMRVRGVFPRPAAIAICEGLGLPIPYLARSKIRKPRDPKLSRIYLDNFGRDEVD